MTGKENTRLRDSIQASSFSRRMKGDQLMSPGHSLGSELKLTKSWRVYLKAARPHKNLKKFK